MTAGSSDREALAQALAERGLRTGDRVLIDTAPLVYLLDGMDGQMLAEPIPETRRNRCVAAFLAAAREAGIVIIASTLIWTELLTGPLRRGDGSQALRFRTFLADSNRIQLESVDVAVAEEAARLRSGSSLELADSIHVGTACVKGAKAVLANDEAWRRVAGCPPIFLVDELAFGLMD